jgi:exosortase/archaeosortase family protein
MGLLFPISKLLFIPFAILLTPFSTLFTWLTLNAFGFQSLMRGQEIFFNNSGINITFSCSGAGQILFSITAMIVFNFCFPLRNTKFLLIQLCRTFLFTFSTNIIRLFLLTIFVDTANSVDFSIFDYLHGGNGGLFFTFFSMLISCESYKRIYFRNT